jgi:hypothetical protein
MYPLTVVFDTRHAAEHVQDTYKIQKNTKWMSPYTLSQLEGLCI